MADSMLLIDDDVEVLRALGAQLERAGYDVTRELSGEAGLATFDRLRPDVVVLDLGPARHERHRGAEPPARARRRGDLLASDGEHDTAVAALASGAESFLAKPVDPAHLVGGDRPGGRQGPLRRVNEALLVQAAASQDLESWAARPPCRRLAQQVRLLAASDRTTVLLEGELGSGKSMVARLIHDAEPRAREPFVEVNCTATTPRSSRWSCSGTRRGPSPTPGSGSAGLFEIADRGTHPADEIGDLPPELQPRLLKLLETRSFRRMGGTREITVDVRLVAATSRTLAAEVESGRFREDLYYRLSVMPLRLPPVRDRSREDRLALLMRLHERAAPRAAGRAVGRAERGDGAVAGVRLAGQRARDAQRARARDDPGARAAARSRSSTCRASSATGPGIGDRRHTPMTLDELERQHIERTLRHHNGNRTRAAQELGISRATLINKIKRYTINV